jgi:hypothetical protein
LLKAHSSKLALNLFLVFFLVTSSALAKVGEVSFQSQPAQITRGSEKFLTEVSTSVDMSDKVETLNGNLKILFIDDTKVTVAEYSTLIIDEFVYDGNTKKGKVNLKASLGTLRYTSGLIAKNSKENVKITTPTASVAVRGTDFEVVVNETGESTFTLLPSIDANGVEYTGVIEVSNATGTVMLTRAFQVTEVASIFTPPTQPSVNVIRRNQAIKTKDVKQESEQIEDEELDKDNQEELFEEAVLIESGEGDKNSIFVIEDDKATFTSDNENKVKLIVPSVSDVSLNYNNNGAVTEGTLNAGGNVSINIIQQ